MDVKRTELRIGNFIAQYKYPDDHKCKYYPGAVTFIGDHIGLIYDDGDEAKVTEDFIEGIPITEEWLLKLGFEADTNIFAQGVYNSPTLGHYIDYDAGIFTYRYYSTSLRDIQSIHQLQNCYFSLTGEELQIKEV